MKKIFVHFLLTAFVAVGFEQSAQAAMVSTAQVVSANAGAEARARLATALQRADVQAALESNGIAPEAAQTRVAALSDDKVREMALRAAGLSDRSLKAITDMINSARTIEGLPDDADTGD